MNIETRLSCGDKVWYYTGTGATQLTVAQVRVEYTESPGMDEDALYFGNVRSGDYMNPKPEQLEIRYMCVETGVGSGSIHELGKTIYLTETDCLAGNAEEIRRRQEARQECKRMDRERLLREQERIARQLLELV